MNNVVADIQHYIDRLLEERSIMQNTIADLQIQVDEVRNALRDKEREIDVLEESNKTLKIAKSLTGTEDRTDAKQRINELVREIDKCIALLHK